MRPNPPIRTQWRTGVLTRTVMKIVGFVVLSGVLFQTDRWPHTERDISLYVGLSRGIKTDGAALKRFKITSKKKGYNRTETGIASLVLSVMT